MKVSTSAFWPIRRLRLLSLRQVIMAWIGFGTGAFLISMVISITAFTLRAETSAWRDRLYETCQNGAGIISSFMMRMQDSLRVVSLIDADYLRAHPTLVQTFMAENQAWLEIIRLDKEGKVFASGYQDNPVLAHLFTISQSTWFRQAAAGQIYYGAVQISATDEPYLIVAIPSPDGGVVAGRLRMTVLRDVTNNIQLGRTGSAIIVNREGLILADPQSQVVTANATFGDKRRIDELLQSPNTLLPDISSSGAGDLVMSTAAPVSGADWVIIAQIPLDESLEVSRSALLVLGGGLVVFCVIMILLMRGILQRQVFAPLDNLREGARRIGAGDLSARADLFKHDEIGAVAETFNDMAQRLSERETLIVSHTAALQESETRYREIAVENARLYTEAEHELAERTRAQQVAEEAQRVAEESRAAAEAANRAKSTFLANMSHELRTPLNAILGFTELLARDGSLTSGQRENLGIVSRSGEHLLALINDVLEMSKIEAGRIELNPTEFDLHHLLQGLEEMFRLRATGSGLRLTMERSAETPRYVRADEGKLRQVLINLLGNAVKFTSQGQVTLRIRCLNASSAPWALSLEFEVEDTGIGIAGENLEAIFEAFVQTAGGPKAQEGTGLGLAISRQYVQMMGGELQVSSEVGKGSRFWFSIPVGPSAESKIKDTRPASHQVVALASDQPMPDGGQYRLLVVEDIQANRQLLVNLLQPLGFEVRQAVDGLEAIEVWKAWQPHLIWMDMRMPVLDGHEATRRIRAEAARQGGQPIIVALTASAFAEERAQILAEGCDDFVSKPFREAEIFETLTRQLGVRFVYQDTVTAVRNEEPDLQARDRDRAALVDALVDQPADWLKELHQATIEGDIDRMAMLVEQIRGRAPVLAGRLDEFIFGFEHKRILELIEQI
ncbi:MAG: ATP-binding protein [Anaerolineae bacterium]